MRVSESRYTRDLRRIQLAQRMIRHEVRTQWICAWAGISDERVRNLCRSYDERRAGVQRHRGPPPTAFRPFLRTSSMRTEASALAGLACALEVVPPEPHPNARKTLPSIERGERLCHTFELFRTAVPASRLTMDQLILLVLTLAEGKELEVGLCSHCHAAVLFDRLGASRRVCERCRKAGGAQAEKSPGSAESRAAVRDEETSDDSEQVGRQQDLFKR